MRQVLDWAALLALLLGAAGCSAAPAKPEIDSAAASRFAAAQAAHQGQLGKPVWAALVIHMCPQPSMLGEDCGSVTPGHRLVPDAIVEGQMDAGYTTVGDGEAYFHVTIDDGRSGYIAVDLMSPVAATSVDPQVTRAQCERKGDPRIGMTVRQVTSTCWGKPDHVNRTETAGSIFDQLVYGDDRYVYLRNGIVTSVQTSGTLR